MLSGNMKLANLFPLTPLGGIEHGRPIAGAWDRQGWSVFLGGLYLAAWSTYAFETTIC
jgi:hypothetical protein